MKSHFNAPLYLAVAVVIGLASHPAEATQRGTSPAGMAYVSGGVSDAQRLALTAERPGFSFWLTTAVLGSGAYLADVKVRITEAGSGKLVFEHTMDGPWLFVALPVGRYDVEATCASGRGGRPETQRTTSTIGVGDHHQAVLYFDTGDKAGEASSEAKAAPASR